ncbi:MAG: hypothetical protein O2782_10605 [bacterium]|nr:hypothetical protein [bacterium]
MAAAVMAAEARPTTITGIATGSNGLLARMFEIDVTVLRLWRPTRSTTGIRRGCLVLQKTWLVSPWSLLYTALSQ